MTEIIERIDRLERVILETLGTRLTREQFRERIGASRKAMYTMIKQGRLPPPVEGKWLLADIVEWERSKALRN